jgi:hypothetical protein
MERRARERAARRVRLQVLPGEVGASLSVGGGRSGGRRRRTQYSMWFARGSEDRATDSRKLVIYRAPISNERHPRRRQLARCVITPNGVLHILRETRAQRRVKVGTDLGRPIFSDERDPNIADHGYDLLRYAIAARPGVPTDRANRTAGTSAAAQRGVKRLR